MSNLGQSMIDYGVRQGIAQGMAQGMAEFAMLNKYLMQQKRFDDLERCCDDPSYRQQLMNSLAPYYKK